MIRNLIKQQPILIILALFIGLGFSASVINPLHEATDELRHYRFVQHIVQTGSLPVQGAYGCRLQAHHPPLFYTLGALATFWIDTGRDFCTQPPTNPFWQYRYWEVSVDNKNQYMHGPDEAFPWHGEALAAHVIRGVNVLLGAAVVWLTWVIGRTIWPRRPALALGGAAFVAFNPMFVYMAGAINNDVLAALSGTAVTLGCLRLAKDENGLSRRWGVILGGAFGMALLSKFNLAAVALLIETAVTWVAWRNKQWRRWLEVNLLIAGVTILIAGWWFVRNQILYGEPTGFERLTELWGVRDPGDSFGTAVFELSYTWTSLWGRFGYGQIPLPEPIYTGLRWFIFFALSGFVIPLIRGRETLRATGFSLLLLTLNVLLFFGVVFNYLLVSPAGAMGRFFFPALPALGLLTFYGLTQWPGLWAKRAGDQTAPPAPLPPRTNMILAIMTNLGMAILTVVALFGYLAPAYARPEPFVASAVPNPTSVQFENFVVLQGYQISDDVLRPGGWIEVDLYWRVIARPPGDYYLFVHLIDENGIIVTQRDTHPGLGNYPSSQWQGGDQFIESIRLHAPETMYTPGTASLSVGFYAPPPESYRLGITAVDGSPLGDAFVLGSIELAELARQDGQSIPNLLQQNFENEIRLVGYEYSKRALQPGDALTVTLYWQALQRAQKAYTVQVHLCEMPCYEWVPPYETADHPLPTNTWISGQIVADNHNLQLDSSLPPGTYGVHVALIDSVTKEPQIIIAEDGHQIDNRLLLAGVKILR